MELLLKIDIPTPAEQVSYRDRILLTGSCFTEHIGNSLEELKFPVLQNPHGILFGPDSVCRSLISYVDQREYSEKDLFLLNGVWHSWDHHSRFSSTTREAALAGINLSQRVAHDFLKTAGWLIITLGSAFTYRLTPQADPGGLRPGDAVANCHRAPSAWFTKELMDTDAIKELLEETLHRLKAFNPGLRFLFTISPVRHVRDGVVENNRSKARLIEAVHYIVSRFESASYFPAYELVIDVLRDYRFYDTDLVHPNYAATRFVLEKFIDTCVDAPSRAMIPELRQLSVARRHKAFHPGTEQHRNFLAAQLEKARELQEKYPYLDLAEEIRYFGSGR